MVNVKRINDWLADHMSRWLSQMWLFWLLTVAILATLFFERPQGVQGWILYWVSVFFQGVALVVINYTSDKQGRTSQALLQETHDEVMAELAEMKEIHREIHAMLRSGDE